MAAARRGINAAVSRCTIRRCSFRTFWYAPTTADAGLQKRRLVALRQGRFGPQGALGAQHDTMAQVDEVLDVTCSTSRALLTPDARAERVRDGFARRPEVRARATTSNNVEVLIRWKARLPIDLRAASSGGGQQVQREGRQRHSSPPGKPSVGAVFRHLQEPSARPGGGPKPVRVVADPC